MEDPSPAGILCSLLAFNKPHKISASKSFQSQTIRLSSASTLIELRDGCDLGGGRQKENLRSSSWSKRYEAHTVSP